MKTILRKSAIAATLILAIAAFSFRANAQDAKLIYEKSLTPIIGVDVYNTVREIFTIKNSAGTIVYQGEVTSKKTFYFPTDKLGSGTFYIYIGNLQMKKFELI